MGFGAGWTMVDRNTSPKNNRIWCAFRNWNVIKRAFPQKQHRAVTSHFGSPVTLVWGFFQSQLRETLCFAVAGYSGVGLLTKLDPIEVKFGVEIPEHDVDGRVITAEYEKFYLVVSYIPNSGRKLVRLEYRREFNRAFHQYLKKLDAKKPVVW